MKALCKGAVCRIMWHIEHNTGYCYMDFDDRWPVVISTTTSQQSLIVDFEREQNLEYASVELIAETEQEHQILKRNMYHLNSKDYYCFCWPPRETASSNLIYNKGAIVKTNATLPKDNLLND